MMIKLKLFLVAFYCGIVSMAQTDTVSFGASTKLYIGERTKFFFGGNTGFNGELENQGTILSYGNLDFKANESVGKLGFVGENDQAIYGGDVTIDSLGVDKSGKVLVKTEQIIVSGNMDILNGAIETEELDDLLVTGSSSSDGEGYVLGKLVGLSTGNDLTFPMGIELEGTGFKNYITFSETAPGVRLIVDCIVNPDSLFLSEEMIGIAEQVEWMVMTAEDSTDARVTVDFSGLDLVNFNESNQINATTYEPAIVILQEGDTLFQILESDQATTENGNTTLSIGTVSAFTTIRIDTTRTRLAIAWIPVIDGPEFFVPNAFSPAGFYEENKVFRPFFAGGTVSSVSMNVFNAYNDAVYQYSKSGSDLDLSLIGWDGDLRNGQPAEEGVYYYTIRLIADGQAYERTSTVLLVK